MLNDYITYDQEFLIMALKNITQNTSLGIDNQCILIEKNIGILNAVIKIYQDLKVSRNAKTIFLKKLTPKEVSNLANDIFISLLPNYQSRILEYDDLLYLYSDFSFSESCYCYDVSEENKVIPQQIQIPESMTEYSIGMINHEKTHTLVMDTILLNQFPSMYFELLPMLIQKITNYEVEQKLRMNQIHTIDDIIRTIDNSKHISVLDIFQTIEIEKESLDNLLIYQYLNLKANDYLISDWYSDLLFQIYLLDSQIIKKELNRVFSNQITLQQMLDYHQIELSNNFLIPTIQKKLKNSKRYSIVQ